MKYRAVLILLAFCMPLFAGSKKAPKTKNILTPTGFDGITVGESKSGVQAKGFRCQDVKIGDYMTLHECRHDIEFAGEQVQAYATLNDAGNKALAVGFDVLYPGDSITSSQNKFYKFVTEVQNMLGTQPAITKTPDTYIALTDFMFPKTIVSCYLYSDDRTKPPKLRCGCEVRARK
jgi:hypothetical protein